MQAKYYKWTAIFFQSLQDINFQCWREAFYHAEMAWESERVFEPLVEVYSLLNSKLFSDAISELQMLKSEEADFFIEGLTNTQWGLNYEHNESSDESIDSPMERINKWIGDISKRDYSLLFTVSTKNFPLNSAGIYTAFLKKEISTFSPREDVNDIPLPDLNMDIIFECYEQMGLDISIVQQKSVPEIDGNLGGTAYRWTEKNELKLGFIYTKREGHDQLLTLESYIILHELGHLIHFYLIRNNPIWLIPTAPIMWYEAMADAFVCIALDMLSKKQDTTLIANALHNERYHRIADALLVIGDKSIRRNEGVENYSLEQAATDTGALECTLNHPFSTVIADKIVQMYKTKGMEFIRDFIVNTHGLRLDKFINTTLCNHISELNVL